MKHTYLFGRDGVLCVTLTVLLLTAPWNRTSEAREPESAGASVAGEPRVVSAQLVDPHEDVAIAGAWERVVAAVENDRANLPVQSRYPIANKVGQRFLGFLEGLLRVSLPYSFECNIRHASIAWNGHIGFPTQRYFGQGIKKDTAGNVFEMPAVRSEVKNGQVIVRVATGDFPSTGKDGIVTLPVGLSKSLIAQSTEEDLPAHITAALFYQSRVFVAVTDTDEPGGSVYCISNGEVVWSKKFARYAGDSYRGSGDWLTEMRVTDKELVLFHCCERSFGIEGLGLDGKSLFEFTSLKVESWKSHM